MKRVCPLRCCSRGARPPGPAGGAAGREHRWTQEPPRAGVGTTQTPDAGATMRERAIAIGANEHRRGRRACGRSCWSHVPPPGHAKPPEPHVATGATRRRWGTRSAARESKRSRRSHARQLGPRATTRTTFCGQGMRSHRGPERAGAVNGRVPYLGRGRALLEERWDVWEEKGI